MPDRSLLFFCGGDDVAYDNHRANAGYAWQFSPPFLGWRQPPAAWLSFRPLGSFDVMSIYWSLKSVPELAPLTRKQRRRVHEQCLRRYFWGAPATRRSIVAYLILLFTVTSIAILGISLAKVFGWPDGTWLIGISALFGTIIGRYVFSRIAIPVLRPFYRKFIETEL